MITLFYITYTAHSNLPDEVRLSLAKAKQPEFSAACFSTSNPGQFQYILQCPAQRATPGLAACCLVTCLVVTIVAWSS